MMIDQMPVSLIKDINKKINDSWYDRVFRYETFDALIKIDQFKIMALITIHKDISIFVSWYALLSNRWLSTSLYDAFRNVRLSQFHLSYCF